MQSECFLAHLQIVPADFCWTTSKYHSSSSRLIVQSISTCCPTNDNPQHSLTVDTNKCSPHCNSLTHSLNIPFPHNEPAIPITMWAEPFVVNAEAYNALVAYLVMIALCDPDTPWTTNCTHYQQVHNHCPCNNSLSVLWQRPPVILSLVWARKCVLLGSVDFSI